MCCHASRYEAPVAADFVMVPRPKVEKKTFFKGKTDMTRFSWKILSKLNFIMTIKIGSGLSLCHSFMRRTHLLSDQLPGVHTGQGLPYLGFSVGMMNPFKMHIFRQSPSAARYPFTNPWAVGLELATFRTRVRHATD